jgi:hypothetical protein
LAEPGGVFFLIVKNQLHDAFEQESRLHYHSSRPVREGFFVSMLAGGGGSRFSLQERLSGFS